MRTLFFDIDGTLLITHQAGSEALKQAIEAEFQISDVSMDVTFGGSTDRYLIAELLRVNGLPIDDKSQGLLRKRYSELLPRVLHANGGTLLPGVTSLLNQLADIPSVRSAVMTGNYPETGRMKLDHFELTSHFAWVSGGDLDVERNDLARRTAQQLARMHGAAAVSDVIVIGDTVKDVSCAHAIGAKCLAVCTGSSAKDELHDAGANWVVDDLTNPETMSILTQ